MEKNVHEIEVKLEKEWIKALEDAFKEKNKEVKLDGFRKGAAPKDVFLKKFGIESLYSIAVDKVVNIAYRKLLDENKLEPIVEPAVDVTGISDTSIIFNFKIVTRPEVKLASYKNLGLKKEKATISEKEVDDEIKNLQMQMADIIVKENGSIAEGDTVMIDFEGIVDGKKLDEACGENYPLEIGSHTFIPGFEEGLIDHKTNDKVTLKLKFPDNYTKELQGKDVTFKVTIHEIKTKSIPEINESFYKDLGYDNIKTNEEFRKEVKNHLKEHKEMHLEDEFMESCLNKIADDMKVDLCDEIVEEEIKRMIDQFSKQLQSQGMDINKYLEYTGTTIEDLKKQMHDEAIKRIKYRLIIEEIIINEKIEVTDDEAQKEAEKQAGSYGISVEELLKAYGTLDVVKYDLKMHKALDLIKENN